MKKTKQKQRSHESGHIVKGVHGGWVIKDAHGTHGTFPSRDAARAGWRAHRMEQKETRKVLGSELAGSTPQEIC